MVLAVSDDAPTPRYTPFLSSCGIWSELASDYAMRADTEAASIGRDMPNRAEQCRELAMRMRAIALDLRRIAAMKHPKQDVLRDVVARWRDAQAHADSLRLPPGKLTT